MLRKLTEFFSSYISFFLHGNSSNILLVLKLLSSVSTLVDFILLCTYIIYDHQTYKMSRQRILKLDHEPKLLHACNLACLL
jgi:hypothetical protein